MAAIAWADVTALPGAASFVAPAVSVAAQNMILGVANTMLTVSVFDGEDGPITKLARVNFAAHLAALEKLGSTGPITSESAEVLARSYATPTGKSLYETTSFGRAFLILIGSRARGPIVL